MPQRTELEYWLALSHIEGAGAAFFSTVLNEISCISSLFEATLPGRLRMLVPAKIQVALKTPDWQAVENDLAWKAKQKERYILTPQDSAYPLQLKHITHPPPILYVIGKVDVLSKPQLAIVGSRNPTATGRETATQFAYALAKIGIVITSGLALGIDGAAHEGALAAGGTTIAVAGTGLDRTYPKEHKALTEKISEQGALVSEFSIGTEPVSSHFPRRNRVISGLANGVLVVEAASKSGALITANYAAIQGREVFAIPGSIHNPLARGCHHLIKQGAKLVEKSTDILEEVRAFRESFEPREIDRNIRVAVVLDEKYHSILQMIGFEVTPIEKLMERTELPAPTITSLLVEMELGGFVRGVPGGYIRNSTGVG